MAIKYQISDNVNSYTYDTLAQGRGPIERTGEIQKNTLTISIAGDRADELPFRDYIRDGYGLGNIKLRVYDDTSDKTLFEGLLYNVNAQPQVITFAFATPIASRTSTDTRKYQRTCPYFLYNDRTCKVNRDMFGTTHTITAIDDTKSELTVTPGVAGLRGGGARYINGSLSFGERTYWIGQISQSGTTLFLRAPILFDIQVGVSTVRTYPSCNKTLADCQFFSNTANFGGFPGYENIAGDIKTADDKEEANYSQDLIAAVADESQVDEGTRFYEAQPNIALQSFEAYRLPVSSRFNNLNRFSLEAIKASAPHVFPGGDS